MKPKKIQNLIAIILFMGILILPTLVWFSFSLYKTLDFDLGEKRNKATLSEVLNIENIPTELENYYNDRIPFRSIIIQNKTIFDGKFEKPYKSIEKGILHFIGNIRRMGAKKYIDGENGNERLYMDDAVDIFLGHGLKKSEIDPYDPYVQYPAKYSENTHVIIGQSDWLYLNEVNIGLYTGKKTISSDKLEAYTTRLETLDKACEKANKKIVFLICPEKEEIYPEYMPYLEIVDEKERALYIKDYIATASYINYVYPKEDLLKAKNKYVLYRKYDSHWNDIGSYIATKKLLEKMGIEMEPIRNQVIKKVPMRDHELIEYGNLSLKNFKEAFEYDVLYKPDVNILTRDFLPGMDGRVSFKSTSDAKTDKKLMILGDSFSHGMIQYLFKEFREFNFVSLKDITDGLVYNDSIRTAVKNSDILVLELVERNDPELMEYLCVKLELILEGLS